MISAFDLFKMNNDAERLRAQEILRDQRFQNLTAKEIKQLFDLDLDEEEIDILKNI